MSGPCRAVGTLVGVEADSAGGRLVALGTLLVLVPLAVWLFIDAARAEVPAIPFVVGAGALVGGAVLWQMVWGEPSVRDTDWRQVLLGLVLLVEAVTTVAVVT